MNIMISFTLNDPLLFREMVISVAAIACLTDRATMAA